MQRFIAMLLVLTMVGCVPAYVIRAPVGDCSRECGFHHPDAQARAECLAECPGASASSDECGDDDYDDEELACAEDRYKYNHPSPGPYVAGYIVVIVGLVALMLYGVASEAE